MATRAITIRAIWLILLEIQLPLLLQGCSTSREHKWLLYDLGKENGVQYQGYVVSIQQEPKHGCIQGEEHIPERGPCTTHDKVQTFIAQPPDQRKPTQLSGFIPFDKPTIDEDDQLHFVYFGQSDILNRTATSCEFVETPSAQPHDAKMAPGYKAPNIKELEHNAQAEEALVREYEKLVERKRQAAEFSKVQADNAKKELKKNPNALHQAQLAEQMAVVASEAMDTLRKAEQQLTDAKLARDQKKAAATATNVTFVCDFDVRDKGGIKLQHTLETNLKPREFEPDQGAKSNKTILVKDSVLVHDLYRFRVLAGPVFSTLNPKTYSLKTDSSGQSEVTASHANSSPANFALMLKTYLWKKRDVLNPPRLFSSQWYEMINPIIGINLFDKPLENLYLGLSLELAGGFDLVGGAHWAKTQQVTGGFVEGQTTTQTNPATRERFNNGWFVGVTADIGIVTAWLKNAGNGLLSAIKTSP